MNNGKTIPVQKNTAGDAIVTGLFAGLLAGLVMLVYLVITGLVAGQPSPGGAWAVCRWL